MSKAPDVEWFIEAARRHANATEEPDHEVGDLQDLARVLWQRLDRDARLQVVTDLLCDDVHNWTEHGGRGSGGR